MLHFASIVVISDALSGLWPLPVHAEVTSAGQVCLDQSTFAVEYASPLSAPARARMQSAVQRATLNIFGSAPVVARRRHPAAFSHLQITIASDDLGLTVDTNESYSLRLLNFSATLQSATVYGVRDSLQRRHRLLSRVAIESRPHRPSTAWRHSRSSRRASSETALSASMRRPSQFMMPRASAGVASCSTARATSCL